MEDDSGKYVEVLREKAVLVARLAVLKAGLLEVKIVAEPIHTLKAVNDLCLKIHSKVEKALERDDEIVKKGGHDVLSN